MIRSTPALHSHDVPLPDAFQERLDALLVACLAKLGEADEAMVERAFQLGYRAHIDDKRASGEPYFTHPIAVAFIVVNEIGFDDVSVAAALLHDVVEDTEFSLDYIRAQFGGEMATIIDGLTKISGVFASRATGQAENVRKLMLSMASDIRVILVKFADRLHNMRTLGALSSKKQLKIASETLDLFAPLAHRFGLFTIKSELEDLSLKYLDPQSYYKIVTGLQETKESRQAYVNSFINPLSGELQRQGLRFKMYGRPKHIYSIYRKMRRQSKPLEEIYDLFAIRIVLESTGKKGKEDCWRVYSIITDLYTPLPERFRDMLSVPKSNGYQSLHTTVLGPEGRRVEVQIRTEEMHEIAERGVAAHWMYKEGLKESDRRMEQFLSWVRDLIENPRPEEATDFVRDFRLNLYDKEIYVFTPNGDVKTLPEGATPVDFAFQVHTEVGFHCIGAKVNGKMVPLSYLLKSGDQVAIITSKKQTPNPDWIKFVVTHKAKSRIRHWVNEERRKATERGRALWEKKARKAGISLDEQMLHRYAGQLKFPSVSQLLYEAGTAQFDLDELVHVAKKGKIESEEAAGDGQSGSLLEFERFLDIAQTTRKTAMLIDGELQTDIKIEYAPCCNPIPGDDVFGFVSRTGIIKIHRKNCRNARHLFVNHAERIKSIEWSRQKDVQFVSGLRIVGEDRVGIASDITTVISKSLKTNIRSLNIEANDGVFEALRDDRGDVTRDADAVFAHDTQPRDELDVLLP
ncbi:MAG: bifunctional (p)ppGpp synthetase/guanosine-3',5'-bis(diphosphate) 3'-pyrophosphohydrolase, partial [Bacteroidota bacterium]